MEGIVMESVWVAVGFVVFVALVWKKAGSAISAMLDERSGRFGPKSTRRAPFARRRSTNFTSSSACIVKLQRKPRASSRRPKRPPSVFAKTPKRPPRKRSSVANSRRLPKSRRPKPRW